MFPSLKVPTLFGADPSPSAGIAQGFSDLARTAQDVARQRGSMFSGARQAISNAADQWMAYKAREKLMRQDLDARARESEADRQFRKAELDRQFGLGERKLNLDEKSEARLLQQAQSTQALGEQGLELDRERLAMQEGAQSWAQSQAARAEAQRQSELMGAQALMQSLLTNPQGQVGPPAPGMPQQGPLFTQGQVHPSPYFPGLQPVPYAEPNLPEIQSRIQGAMAPQQPPGGMGPPGPQPSFTPEMLGQTMKSLEMMRPGLSQQEAFQAMSSQAYPASPLLSAQARAGADLSAKQQAAADYLAAAAVPQRASKEITQLMQHYLPDRLPDGVVASFVANKGGGQLTYDPAEDRIIAKPGVRGQERATEMIQNELDMLRAERPKVFDAMVGQLGGETLLSMAKATEVGRQMRMAGPPGGAQPAPERRAQPSPTATAPAQQAAPQQDMEPAGAAEQGGQLEMVMPPTTEPAGVPEQVPDTIQRFRNLDMGYFGVGPTTPAPKQAPQKTKRDVRAVDASFQKAGGGTQQQKGGTPPAPAKGGAQQKPPIPDNVEDIKPRPVASGTKWSKAELDKFATQERGLRSEIAKSKAALGKATGPQKEHTQKQLTEQRRLLRELLEKQGRI